MKKPLKFFLITEAVLLVLAFIIYLMTMNSEGFEMFAILYPIYGMFFVGIIAMIYMIASASRTPHKNPKTTDKFKKTALVFIFGLPILYISGFAGGGLYTQLILLMFILVAIRDFFPLVYRILIDALLVATPIALIAYASTLNDTNIFNFTIVIAGGFALTKFIKTSKELVKLKNPAKK